MLKWTEERINYILSPRNIKLIGKYTRYGDRHDFSCLIHNKICKSLFSDIIRGHGLRCCSSEKLRQRNSLSITSAKSSALAMGFELISNNWLGSRKRYNFRCLKHDEIHESSWRSLTMCKSIRCCKLEKLSNYKHLSGKKHPNYNPKLTVQERKGNRNRITAWRKKIYKKFNHMCQVCNSEISGFRKKIAHHYESYAKNKKLRYDLDNGVCLCEDCHIKFHKQYGFGNNTKQQFLNFKRDYK